MITSRYKDLAIWGAVLTFSSLALSSCGPVDRVEAVGPEFLPDDGGTRVSLVTPEPTVSPIARVIVAQLNPTVVMTQIPDVPTTQDKQTQLRYSAGTIVYQGDRKINSGEISLTLDDSCQAPTIRETQKF